MKKLLFFLMLALMGNQMYGQTPSRTYKSHKLLENGEWLHIIVSDGTYMIRAINANTIETNFIPTGEEYNAASHAIVPQPKFTGASLSEKDNLFRYETAGISVNIQKNPFKISYGYKGKALIAEKAGYIKTDSLEKIQLELDDTEILYGGGARVLGMNHRGHRLELYNRAHYGYETHSELMNYTMPLVISSKIYAVHFDNPPIGFLDLDSKKNNTLQYETISGRKTYQIVAGDDWKDLINQYTTLTGKQPLPPRWAFGNFASRFGYHTEKETREVVKKFRDAEIPLDAVIVDIYWFGADIKGHMGNLEFLKDSFPTPKQMMADFKKDNIQTILVTEPFVLTTSKKWDEAVKKNVLAVDSAGKPFKFDFYFGNTGLIDIYKKDGKDWFWNIYKKYTDMGVSGWWGDLGEPEVHPSDLQHATGSADEVHNIYGHDWARLVYEGFQKDFPNRRPFILMRAGSSSSQRFGLIPWSGDVSRSWGGLKPQPEIALSMGMQGLGYMHSDLGGFAGGEKPNAELYTRWLQYGVFQPIYRPHAQEHIPAEPVFWDDKTKALAKKSIELRYRMLPYNYTTAFQNNQTGLPFMRPLFFEESDNPKLLEETSAYFWGQDIIVSPVMEAGLKEQEVYLPKGNIWFDFYTDKKYEGGQKHHIALSEDKIPVFVRGGEFITMTGEDIQNTAEYDSKSLEVHYYHTGEAKTSSYTVLYHDDGQTPNAYKKGMYELLTFKSKTKKGSKFTLDFEHEIGANQEGVDRNIKLVVHGWEEEPKVSASNKSENWEWDEETKTFIVYFSWAKDEDVTLKFK